MWLPFLGAIVLATLTFPLRTVRWRYILRLEGVTLPFVPLWHATAIGFMANNLLPARAGELARGYAASQLTRARFTSAMGSIAVERVLDGVTLVALLLVAIWAGGFAGDSTVGGVSLLRVAESASILFSVLLGVLLVFVHWPEPMGRLARAIAGRLLPPRWADRAVETLEGLVAGLDALKSVPRLLWILFWSFIVWGTMAASLWLAFSAFHLPAPWSASLLLLALIAFGVAIPSTPGFFGPFEAATRVAFAAYGLDATSAVSYALGYHIATFLPITLLGIWSLGRSQLHLGELRGQKRQ